MLLQSRRFQEPDHQGRLWPPLPALRVEKTLWHPSPDRRRAWLRVDGEDEARRVVEGDVVEGLLVAEIEPSGVVLERDGQRIQRGLGSADPTR